MNYIVFDLEWNQSGESQTEGEKALSFEVIEIGAVKLNEKKQIIGKFDELIKPQVYPELHYITQKLVHLQTKDLAEEKSFVDIIKAFLTWCGKDILFCTWGPLDLLELQRNMKYYGLPPLAHGPIAFLDIQKLFSIAFEDKKQRRALEYAVDYLEIEKDIPFHRAFSDAYYTARVFEKIKEHDVEKNLSFDTFTPPKSRKEEVKITFDTYFKYISKEFPDRLAAMKNREVVSTKCYLCHKNLRKKIRWFSPNGRHYISVSYCEKHGPMKGKIRLKKSENNQVFVVKTLKFISWKEVEKIKEKRKQKHKPIEMEKENGQA